MADDNQSSRTEQATERRREEARKKGQFAVSSELSAAILLLSAVLLFWGCGTGLGSSLSELIRSAIGRLDRTDLDAAETRVLLAAAMLDGLKICGVVLAALFMTGLATGLLQVGFNISFDPLNPDWSRISPVKGWQKLFSVRTLIRTLLSLVKATAVMAVFWWMVQSRLLSHDRPALSSLEAVVERGWDFVIHFSLAVAGFLTVIALLDVLFQKWKHEQDLRMTKQEIKEEHKQMEGDPLMRARIRKLQREAAQRRMLDSVPGATVVLTNPTHYAVVLKYDRATMSAPQVVAKGKDFLAKRIIKIAKEHDVPVLERKPLARALYATVPIGGEIPQELYQAIAEILVYVFGLKRAA